MEYTNHSQYNIQPMGVYDTYRKLPYPIVESTYDIGYMVTNLFQLGNVYINTNQQCQVFDFRNSISLKSH